MDIASCDRTGKPSIEFCNCYKVWNLTETILGATLISNLSDQYVIGKQLGWGQFGVIRECSDKLTGEVLACKSIAKDRLVTGDDVRSIKLEIEIMTRLSGHPNVVDLKAVYEEEDFVHLVMELCAGGELFHRLEKYGRFSENEARVIFMYLMQVVKYCHDNGVVHRDLKPENILLATTSSSSPIKLADFGLATYIKPGQNLHGAVGSPFYIAPEVLSGGYNQAADVWSAGVILYVLLSGMPPFWGKTKSKIFEAVRAADLQFPFDPWDQISSSAQDLIVGMLCIDSSKRLSAEEVLAHSWIGNCARAAQELLHKPDALCCEKLGVSEDSISAAFIAMKDYSFGDGHLEQSPAFTCKSSFSTFLVDNGTPSPCSAKGGFSFSSCCESSAADFSSPIPSMPSFTFLSPSSAVEIHRESNLAKLFVLPGKHELGEMELETEIKRAGMGWSRILGVHIKRRNRTIGVGEFDQLNLMASESVIRWASCTDIPTAPSLRSSLVC